MLSADQRRSQLIEELRSKGLSRLKTRPPLEKKPSFRISRPSAPPPIQALDTIQFEAEFENNQIEQVRFKVNNGPESVERATAKVPEREKRVIKATNVISSIGTGLGSTMGIMMRFNAPIAIGGAGFVIGTTLMIGLIAGCGVAALGLAYFVRRYYTKEAIKKVGLLIEQIEHFNEKLTEKAVKVEHELSKSFGMLVKMQLALDKLKTKREALSLTSEPSAEEISLQEKINEYINFLVIDPDHPNLCRIKDEEKRDEARRRAIVRQDKIRSRLHDACKLIESGQFTITQYINNHPCEIRRCFPSLHLVAPKIKTSARKILFTPGFGLAALGGFTGTFGLSYSTLSIMITFAVIPMAFPPLYAILGVAALGSLIIGYSMYKMKAKESERRTYLKNQQKYLGYLTRAETLLSERYTHELEDYSKDQSQSIEAASAPTPAARPATTMQEEPKRTMNKEPDVSTMPFFKYEQPIEPLSDLSFRDPSQQLMPEKRSLCQIT